MSEKYGYPSATYNIPLNSSENDIFRIGCAHLFQFLHINVKTADCKPMMLKMHLELGDSPSTGEVEERNIEHNNSNNGLRQSVQQLEEEMKALKDALLQAKYDVVNRIDKAPNVDNNAMQESNSNNQANNENKLSGEHNDTENVASASEEHHTNTTAEEKPDVIDLRRCAHLSHVLHINIKTADCKPMMLKKHLELDDSPSTRKAEERNVEHNNSNNGLRQPVQQLEEEMKALKDALLQAKDDVVNRTHKAPNVDNNATQESNSNNQANNKNKLSGEHNDTENVATASEEYHTNTTAEEKPDVTVYIQNYVLSQSTFDTAFCNISNEIYPK